MRLPNVVTVSSHTNKGPPIGSPTDHPHQERRRPTPRSSTGTSSNTWLAERFNAYLADNDEHRAITRHLLHLGGQVSCSTTGITITLDRPDTPRIARALTLLTDELNNTPAHLPGDRRPLTYQVKPA